MKLEPQPNITVNVRDTWYVECEAHVLTLGYVERESMKCLLDKHERILHEHLNEARKALEPRNTDSNETLHVNIAHTNIANGAHGAACPHANVPDREHGIHQKPKRRKANNYWVRGK